MGFKLKRSIDKRDVRSAMKQIHGFLKSLGIGCGQIGKQKKFYINLYCEIKQIETPISKASQNEWLVTKYRDPDFDLLGSRSERNYTSAEWKRIRKIVFKMYGKKCMKCNSTEDIAVDHIKPYSIFPDLSTDIDNLQVLCRSCNSSKSNKKIVDYRPTLS